jgi:hypothetical protein
MVDLSRTRRLVLMLGMQVSFSFSFDGWHVYDMYVASMSVAETLEFVKVEWVADRSVRVKIKESILTLST